MLYVSKIWVDEYGVQKASIMDSGSGKVFEVVRKEGRKWYRVKWYRGWRRFRMRKCLGYLHVKDYFGQIYECGLVCKVDKRVVDLLKYIENAEFVEDREDAIKVSDAFCTDVCRYGVLYLMSKGSSVLSLLDFILAARGSEHFAEMLKSGEIVVRLGREQCLSIKLYGDYMGYIAKLITFAGR